MVCAALQRRRRPSAWGHGLLGRLRHARGLADALAAGSARVCANARGRLLRTARGGAGLLEGAARCGRMPAPCGLLSEPNLAGRRAGCGCEQLDLWRGGGAQASDYRTLPWRVACWGRADGSFAQSRRIGRLHAAKPMAGSLCHAAGSTSRSCQPRARFSHAAVCVNAAAAAAWGIMP